MLAILGKWNTIEITYRTGRMIMNKVYIPAGYKPVLDAYDTQRAIAYIKKTFQQHQLLQIFQEE